MARDFMLLEALQTISVQEALPWLGRIVQFYQKPMAAYVPVDGQVLDQEPHEDSHFSNVKIIASKFKSETVKADFLELFGFDMKSWSSQSYQVENRAVQRLRIHNDDIVLGNILQKPGAIERLESWGLGVTQPAFMVVGLLVADNIRFRDSSSHGKVAGAHFDPAGAATMAGFPMPSTTPLAAIIEDKTKLQTSMLARGKGVFAVEYRVFRRKMTANPWGPVSKDNTKLEAHGPQGDRSFDLAKHLKMSKDIPSEEPDIEFIEESLDEFVNEEAEDRCFRIGVEEEQP